jgi:hypothetical protein
VRRNVERGHRATESRDAPDPRLQQRRTQDVLDARGPFHASGLDCERERELRIDIELRERRRRELAGPSGALPLTRIVPLGEREDRQQRHPRERDERQSGEDREPPVA